MAGKPKVNRRHRLSETRVEDAISDFCETLGDFCAAMLSNGSRNGNEWQVPDLDNSPRHDGKPGSCCVNLETGCFYDHNPAAEPQKGGPVQLWTALFGVTDFVEIILGMERWVKDGSLPDGCSGVRITSKIEVAKDEIITARDDYEKELVRKIRAFQNWIEDREKNPDPTKSEHYRYRGFVGNVPYEEYDWVTHNKKMLAHDLRLIRRAKSDIYSHRWLKAVEQTEALKEEFVMHLTGYRGLSPDVFRWMIDEGLIVLYVSERINATTGDKWESMEIAFPVVQDVQWSDFPDRWVPEFLGMHIKWRADTGRSGWRYEPKGNGCGSVPFIIGELSAADLIVIGESTWDVISFIDLYRLHERGLDRPWAAIDTRGASNAAKIPTDRIKPDATILLLLQNDQNEANDRWCAGLPFAIRERGRQIIPPPGTKDLNDWMRKAKPEEIRKILEHK
jgi:hypothetical protein